MRCIEHYIIDNNLRYHILVKSNLWAIINAAFDWLSYYEAICYSPQVAKSAALKTKTMEAESRFV